MIRVCIIILFAAFSFSSYSQYMKANSMYIGVKPRSDYNPYETSSSTSVNILPFIYEYRHEEYKGIQVRPILDLSFGGGASQISAFGLTGAYNIYFSDAIKRNYFIKPNAAAALTYSYNRLDEFNGLSLSLEPSISVLANPNFLITAGLNPSLSYFIGKNGKAAAGNSSGFKADWGFFLHLGYNMFSVMY